MSFEWNPVADASQWGKKREASLGDKAKRARPSWGGPHYIVIHITGSAYEGANKRFMGKSNIAPHYMIRATGAI